MPKPGHISKEDKLTLMLMGFQGVPGGVNKYTLKVGSFPLMRVMFYKQSNQPREYLWGKVCLRWRGLNKHLNEVFEPTLKELLPRIQKLIATASGCSGEK